MSTPHRSTNRAAARATAERAIPVVPDPAARKQLLDLLGLLGDNQPCSNHDHPHPGVTADLTDDELRTLGAPMTAVNSDLGEHLPLPRRGAHVATPPPLRGALCPPGLRAAIQNARPAEPAAPAPQVAPTPPETRTPRQPRPYVPKPPRPSPPLAPCGTEAGHRRHVRNGEPIDQACRQAHNEAGRRRRQRRREAKIAAGLAVGRPPARCGTPAGYKKHARENTEKCGPCLAAKAAETKHYADIYRARRTAQAARAA
jgi:hypothetical protein